MSWYLKLFARICANASWKFHTPPPPPPSPPTPLPYILLSDSQSPSLPKRRPCSICTWRRHTQGERKTYKNFYTWFRFIALWLCFCVSAQEKRVGGVRVKGQRAATSRRDVGGWRGVGAFSCLWIFQSQKDTQLETFNTLTANWIRIQIIHPPLFPPSLSLPLTHLPLLILFFPLFFLCLRWDKCKTLTGISLPESIAKLLVSFMFLFTDTTNTLHDPPPPLLSQPLLVITFDDLLHGARAVNCQ